MASNVLVFHPLQDSQAHLVQSTHARELHVHAHGCIYGGSDVAFSHMVLSWPLGRPVVQAKLDCSLGDSQCKSQLCKTHSIYSIFTQLPQGLDFFPRRQEFILWENLVLE